MMSLLKYLFGSKESSDRQVRRLSHPRDLRTGDIIKFAFLRQGELGDKEFEITQINTYIYGEMCYPELVLKDREGNLCYMMVEEEDGEEYLAISKKIPKLQLDDIIPAEILAKITTPGSRGEFFINQRSDLLTMWRSPSYKKTGDNIRGSFLKGDARYLNDEEIKQRDHFTSFILEDDTEEFALEIEIYETGEIEMCVTVYHEIRAISEMWPGKGPTLAS